MKHKRLLLFFGCLAAVLLAGYGTLRLTAPRHRITPENIRSIKRGMTEKEAEELMRLLRKAIAAGNELSRAPLRDMAG